MMFGFCKKSYLISRNVFEITKIIFIGCVIRWIYILTFDSHVKSTGFRSVARSPMYVNAIVLDLSPPN